MKQALHLKWFLLQPLLCELPFATTAVELPKAGGPAPDFNLKLCRRAR
jgi:hypothetical protein